MRIGFALEGLLAPTIEDHFSVWQARSSVEASSYLDPKCVRDETFWATLSPHPDLNLLGQEIEGDTVNEYFVLTERPLSLHLVTRSWLRRHGLKVPDAHIRYASIGTLKRYDCRLQSLDYFFDCDPEVLNSFVYDWTIPVGVGPEQNFKPWVQAHKTLYDAILYFEPDRRDWMIWENS